MRELMHVDRELNVEDRVVLEHFRFVVVEIERVIDKIVAKKAKKIRVQSELSVLCFALLSLNLTMTTTTTTIMTMIFSFDFVLLISMRE